MEFEWDQEKSNWNYKHRAFDFAYAIQIFLDNERIIFEDDRFEYGEKRYSMLGKIENRLFAITFTLRAGKVRIISARKANTREINHYEKHNNKS